MNKKNESTPADPQEPPKAAIDALDAEIGELLNEDETGRVKVRYEVARKLLEAKGRTGRATYGAGVVEKVARRRGVSAKAFHRWIQVAKKIDPDAMSKLCARRRKRSDKPLEWKHYEALAGAPPTIRDDMIKVAFAENLSARKLQKRIKDRLQQERDAQAHAKNARDATRAADAADNGSADGETESPEDPAVTPALAACLRELDDYVSGAAQRTDSWLVNLNKTKRKPACTTVEAAHATELVNRAERLVEDLKKIAAIAQDGCKDAAEAKQKSRRAATK